MTAAYKFLREGRKPPHGRGIWTPGRARSVNGAIVPCERGIHYCRPAHLSRWVNAELWTFEDLTPDETIEHAGSKMVTRRGKIVERVTAWDADAIVDLGFHAADRACRVHAPAALAAAGVADQAESLCALPPIVSHETAKLARVQACGALIAAREAESVAWVDLVGAGREMQLAISGSKAARRTAARSSFAWSAQEAAVLATRAAMESASHTSWSEPPWANIMSSISGLVTAVREAARSAPDEAQEYRVLSQWIIERIQGANT